MKKILIALSIVANLLFSLHTAQAQSWNEIVNKAKGQTIYFNAWGGSPIVNKYIQDFASRLKKEYGITLVHVKVNSISETITRTLAEKVAGNDKNGKADLVWVNGENFYTMKKNNLLYGPILNKLPNVKYIDTNNSGIIYDFSVSTDGLEAPWGHAQLVFIYDRNKVQNPPKSAEQFLSYAKSNPGKITYPELPDFTGTTFIKQMLIELAPDKSELLKPATKESYAAQTANLWQWLKNITPYLWQNGKKYPKNESQLRELLNQGIVDVAFSFTPLAAASNVIAGDLPKSVKTYVLDGGTIANTHFLAIPYNAKATEASLVVINSLLSPLEQLEKFQPKNWGDYPVLDQAKLPKMWADKFNKVDIGEQSLKASELGVALPEPNVSWVELIEKDWQKFIKDLN